MLGEILDTGANKAQVLCQSEILIMTIKKHKIMANNNINNKIGKKMK